MNRHEGRTPSAQRPSAPHASGCSPLPPPRSSRHPWWLTLSRDFTRFEFCKRESYSVCSLTRRCFHPTFSARSLFVRGVAVVHSRCSVRAGPQCLCPFCRLILASFPVFGQDENPVLKVLVPVFWWVLKWPYQFHRKRTRVPILLHSCRCMFCESVYEMKIASQFIIKAVSAHCRNWSTRGMWGLAGENLWNVTTQGC